MSLPKEPRQLMINLMYLVLTAMLALNVSAEILNAFVTMDEGIQESNQIINRSNEALYQSIAEQAKAYPQYEQYENKAKKVKQAIAKFCSYVESIKSTLIEETGGYDEENELVGKKEKDITSRMLVDQGLGNELRDSVFSAREQLLGLIEDENERNNLQQSIPLKVKAVPKNSDKKDWAEFTFRQMPVVAVLPLLSKFQSDARLSETSVLNFLANKISAKPVHNEYKALIAADKSYVIQGEQINAEIFLGAYSSTTDNIDIKVNGSRVPVRNGKALYTANANQLGDQVLNVEITAKDPLTGSVKKYTEKYNYKVGEQSVTTSADKMNVFYVGVKNPFSISAAGIPSEEVKVSAEGVTITKNSSGKYTVVPSRPGKTVVKVSGGSMPLSSFEYRVKPIPTPIAKLGNKPSGTMSANEFKIYKKIDAHLEQFDFDAKCKITGFTLVRVDKSGDGFENKNAGNKYATKSMNMVNSAKRGDQYYFENIKAKCPGDKHNRTLNALFFKIR